MGGVHVHALYPPEGGVSPVAPLVGDEEAADDCAIGLGDDVEAFERVVEHGGDAGCYGASVKGLVFGFERHVLLEANDGGGVVGDGWADGDGQGEVSSVCWWAWTIVTHGGFAFWWRAF